MAGHFYDLHVRHAYIIVISMHRPAPAPPGPRSKKLLKMSSFVEIDSTPRSADHVVAWFKEVEAPKGVGKETDGSISIWFHGM